MSQSWLQLAFWAATVVTCLQLNWTQAEEQTSKVYYETETPLKAFNDIELGLSQDKLAAGRRVHFEALGWVTPLNSGMDPEMFSSSFGLHTRARRARKVYFPGTMVEHSVKVGAENRTMSASYQFDMANFRAAAADFDPNKRTILVATGWRTPEDCDWQNAVRDAWLELEDVNVITYHWPTGNHAIYERSVANLRLASRQIVIMFYYLTQLKQVDLRSEEFLRSIYMIGHSLGAHMCAFVSQELGSNVGRITGLDPAGPLFHGQPYVDRLDKTDALLVDAYHTNAGQLDILSAGMGFIKSMLGYNEVAEEQKQLHRATEAGDDDDDDDNMARKLIHSGRLASNASSASSLFYGISQPVGHMDVYVNGGSLQLGCQDTLRICDHDRANKYYISALQYEIQLRKDMKPLHPHLLTKHHRLRTIRGIDYSDFRSGRSLSTLCSQLISGEKLTLEQHESALKQCTLPIDYVATPQLIRQELVQEYRLNLDRPMSDIISFLDTTSADPFMSGTYLLKLHLKRPDQKPQRQATWQKGCKLSSLMLDKTSGGSSVAQYTEDRLQAVDGANFYGLVIPVANTFDWRHGGALSNRNLSHPSQLEMNKLGTLLAHYVPSRILLKLEYAQQVGPSKGFFNSLFHSAQQDSLTCRLSILRVQIEPLVRSYKLQPSYWFAPHYRGPAETISDNEEVAKLATEPFEVNSKHGDITSLGLKYVSIA